MTTTPPNFNDQLKRQFQEAFAEGHSHCTEEYCDVFLSDDDLDSYLKVVKQAVRELVASARPQVTAMNTVAGQHSVTDCNRVLHEYEANLNAALGGLDE